MQQQSAIQCNQGERLKRLRAALQVEWKVFAKRMDLSVSMCMQVVKGTKNLSDLTLFRLETLERSAGLSPSSPPVRLAVEGASGAKEKDSICDARVELARALDQIEAGVMAMRQALKRVNK